MSKVKSIDDKIEKVNKEIGLYALLTQACADYFSEVCENGEVNDHLNSFIDDVKVQIALDERAKGDSLEQ